MRFKLRTLLLGAIVICLTAPTWPAIGRYFLNSRNPPPNQRVRIVIQPTTGIPLEVQQIEEGMRIDELQHQERLRSLFDTGSSATE